MNTSAGWVGGWVVRWVGGWVGGMVSRMSCPTLLTAHEVREQKQGIVIYATQIPKIVRYNPRFHYVCVPIYRAPLWDKHLTNVLCLSNVDYI